MSVQKKKIARRRVHGVFLLNKPLEISSNAALQKVRWLFRAEKAGHTGALDPLATGLLPICLGEATKFSHYLLESEKRYQTTLKLGETTTTGDVEGEILKTRAVPQLTEENIEHVLAKFRGHTQQIPPMYSALKQQGRPLYELARQGITVERMPRPIFIAHLTLMHWTTDSITLDVVCSKGTYIRVLGEDIGEALGCGAHLSALHRIATGHFNLIPEYTIEYLESLTEQQRDELLLPAFEAVSYLPKVQVPEGRASYFCNGLESNIEAAEAEKVLVFDGDHCLGLAQITDKKRLVPKRVLNLYK
ncbi:tRNA pseudouridine(55) synthase TruB [Acinetobacter sp. B5B]|uniref:tRNA pseudouridine(55) synthase TruB n=1 Tax=Acinetobacter baretiae TaxID=2605383 RepID=UPI0018C2305E|nr:tRNA pseudouridine(55) synthase TruB [Acinetobacter baretiae]MBF7682826.1 tRNA pseudouridine(55) synthase TruB [Acinetobacter baretiae]